MEEEAKKRKANRIRPLWRDLMKYRYSPPLLQKYQAEMMRSIPIGSTRGGMLGVYDVGENSKDVQSEVARINAENAYLENQLASNWEYPVEAYRKRRPMRIATDYNPERFVRAVAPVLPALISQPAYTADDPMTESHEAVEKLLPNYSAWSFEAPNPPLLGSSYVYQLDPKSYSNVDPNIEFNYNYGRVRPGSDVKFLAYENPVEVPAPRYRNIPMVDLREIFPESDWPVIHQDWPERSIVETRYYSNTPGSQRIADYYGFKGMQDEARREFYNTPPVTMVMPRPIIRPQEEYDPVVAGYLPLMKLPQTTDEQKPARYERASGHIKELKRPARSQY